MATIYTKRLHIFCASNRKGAADTAVKNIDSSTDLNTFTSEFSPNGKNPVTHLAASGVFTEDMFSNLRTAIASMSGDVTIYDGDTWTWDQALADMGLTYRNRHTVV